jgi:hypothetical protein
LPPHLLAEPCTPVAYRHSILAISEFSMRSVFILSLIAGLIGAFLNGHLR